MTPKKLRKLVYDYPTKYKEGLLPNEIKDILEQFPNINMDKYDDAMMGNTCSMREGKLVMYHCDILTAITCGIENRYIKASEWD